jgi:4-amino-4-deoxy-L-arabinose transferase-like glycosyltransferase
MPASTVPKMPVTPESEPHAAEGSPGSRPTLVAALLLIGVALFVADPDFKSHPQYVAMALGALAFIPGAKRPLARALDRLRAPSARIKWIVAIVIFVLSARYFLLSASVAGRELFPTFHDEHMYLLQARMLASGHLWMPAHEIGQFFDSFFVVVRPVYAATYFPGTALLYVPGVWLKLAPWATSVSIAALAVMMFYIVFTEMLDGVAGLLAALLALSLEQLRGISVMAMSHPALLTLTLFAIWAYLRWRRRYGLGWALMIGVFSGWAMITRPLDAICLIVPLGLAMCRDLFFSANSAMAGDRAARRKRSLRSIAAILLGAIPFLSLQLIFDKGVTGHFLQTPIGQYGQRNFPGLSLGSNADPQEIKSSAALPQVRDYDAHFLRPELQTHARQSFLSTWLQKRFMPTLDAALPGHVMYLLLPVGLLALRRPERAAVVSGGFLLPLAYALFPIYLKHYGLVAAPAFILLALLGERVFRRAFPALGTALVIAIAALAIGSLPELRGARDGFMQAPYLSDINAKLAQLEHTPAVVLFHYESGRTDVHEEPVYNLDTAWPDDARVIRAQDLGNENWRIFNYYARHEPHRFFYRYDRSTGTLTELGWAKELSKL